MFKELYKRVKTGKETARVICAPAASDYKERLDKELDAIGNSEMWQAGKAVRNLRPKTPRPRPSKATKGVYGRGKN